MHYKIKMPFTATCTVCGLLGSDLFPNVNKPLYITGSGTDLSICAHRQSVMPPWKY